MAQLVFVALVLVSCAFCHASIVVSPNVFSGTPNPTWELNPEDESFFRESMLVRARENKFYTMPYKMGYTGFDVTVDGERVHVYNDAKLELWLLNSGLKNDDMSASVVNRSFECFLMTSLVEAH